MLEKIRDREVLIVGLARSGLAAARLAAQLGARRIIVSDSKPAEALADELAALARIPRTAAVTGRQQGPELITTALSVVIKSPGVPPHLELFRQAAAQGIPVLSEIELAYASMRAPVVGITGTNGKTTTTMLVAAILREARFDPVIAAGNIGLPLSEAALQAGLGGVVAAELSSFQLEDIADFRTGVAVFLNFEPDHLDYHGTLERYFDAKSRILENQQAGDYAVLNAADPAVAALAERVQGELIWFRPGVLKQGFGVRQGELVHFHARGETVILAQKEIALPGEHNLENALAATAAAWAAGADLFSAATVLRTFRGIEHRVERVVIVDGVEYVNDSKGTNPGATRRALRSFPGRPKILIAGGKDKGADFASLAGAIRAEARLLILLGETAPQIAAAADRAGFSAYTRVADLEEAVAVAARQARRGDVVLLSPACASWDMFKDYEARGRLFKALVHALPGERTGG